MFDRVNQIAHRLDLGDPIEWNRDIIEVFDRHDEIHHPQRIHSKVSDNIGIVGDLDRMAKNLFEDRRYVIPNGPHGNANLISYQ